MISSDKNQKLRIKDIARMAGVSEGTVDRVLHKRGQVSEESREKIEKIIREQQYEPNPLARSLALKKQSRFAVLIPWSDPHEYWHAVSEGVDTAAREVSAYGVTVEKVFFDQYDSESYSKALDDIVESAPDAVMLTPFFADEALRVCQKMDQKGIPYVFIDSNLEQANSLAYYGQDSFQSGYVAAKLLSDHIGSNAVLIYIRTRRKASSGTNQTSRREQGFLSFFKEKDNFRLKEVMLDANDQKATEATLDAVFGQEQNVGGIAVFNSRVYRTAAYLRKRKITGVRLIGYDLLDENVKHLKQGTVTYLIAQRPEQQSYRGIMALCQKIVFDKKIERVNYVPIDILIKENIDYYIHF